MLAMMWLSVEAPKFTFTYQIQRLLNILNTNLDNYGNINNNSREASSSPIACDLISLAGL